MKFKHWTFGLLLAFMLTIPAADAKKNKEIIIPANYPEKYDEAKIIEITPMYKEISEAQIVYVALDMLRGTNGDFSRKAIMGNNLSGRPVKVEFKNLGEIRADYAQFDALGWKKGKYLYIFINPKHQDAPPAALAALLSHEALHQDEYNSLAEEVYAWTMEATVWCELLKIYPESEDENLHPLVNRENTLKKLFERGNYTNQYIKKTVMSNPGYSSLPSTSPGFEDL